MKVVFIADCLTTQRAGIHYYAKNFIPRVIKRYPGHSYYHLTTEDYDIEGSSNIVVPVNKAIPFHYRIRYFTSIPKALHRIGVDVAIEMAHFGPFLLNKTIKKITMIHDLTPIMYPQYHDNFSVVWHKLFFKRLAQSVDSLMTNSQSTKTDIINQFSIAPKKIFVNYPIIQKKEIEEKNRKEVYTFLTVGTIEPRKRHLFILDGLERYYANGNMDFSWVVIGQKGWRYEEFFDKLNVSPIKDKIEITGYVDETTLSKLYREADCFLYASEYEGFGMPILEAMSYNMKLVLSNTMIHREVAGLSGAYFNTIEELSKLLNFVKDNDIESSRAEMDRIIDSDIEVPFL